MLETYRMPKPSLDSMSKQRSPAVFIRTIDSATDSMKLYAQHQGAKLSDDTD